MPGYEIITLVIAAIAMVTGILLIASPSTLIKAGEFFNRIYNVESVVYTKRIQFGFVYVICGGVLFYILW